MRRVAVQGISRRRAEADILEHGQRDLSCVVGGCAPTATPGRTNEGCGLPGSGLGRGRIRDEDGSQSLPPGRNLPFGRCLADGKGMPVLVAGGRGVERYPDRRGQPLLVRAFRVACIGRADDTLGQGQEPRPGMLHSRAHRVPDECDADLGVLRAGLSPAPVKERQYLLRNRTLDENGIRTRV
jgi:hypothetical protein